MMSTWPVILLIHINMLKPSGYCGANKSILQTGKKNTAIKAPDANATSILDVTVNLLSMYLS